MGKIAVVLGKNHINTLGLIRSIGEQRIKLISIIVNDDLKCNNWVLKSKYVSENYVCYNDENSIVACLISVGMSHANEQLFFFPANDNAVVISDRFYTELSPYYVLPHIDASVGKLENLMSKTAMVTLAEKAGFLTPKTFLLDFSEDRVSMDSVAEFFKESWPVLVRPDSQNEVNCSHEIVNSITDLGNIVQSYHNGCAILQEYIEKDEELGICGVGFGSKRPPFIPAIISKIRTSTVSKGSTTYAQISACKDRNILKMITSFITSIGYSGVFDIELMRKGNNYYFIECNFRNGGYGYAYTKKGFNLPTIWMSSTFDSCENPGDLKLINGFSDIKNVKNGNVSLLRWLKQVICADVYMTWSLKDQGPFWKRLFEYLR